MDGVLRSDGTINSGEVVAFFEYLKAYKPLGIRIYVPPDLRDTEYRVTVVREAAKMAMPQQPDGFLVFVTAFPERIAENRATIPRDALALATRYGVNAQEAASRIQYLGIEPPSTIDGTVASTSRMTESFARFQDWGEDTVKRIVGWVASRTRREPSPISQGPGQFWNWYRALRPLRALDDLTTLDTLRVHDLTQAISSDVALLNGIRVVGNGVHVGPGLILTNEHVIREYFPAGRMDVLAPNSETFADAEAEQDVRLRRLKATRFEVLFSDSTLDIALIKVETPTTGFLAAKPDLEISFEPLQQYDRIVSPSFMATARNRQKADRVELLQWVTTGIVIGERFGSQFVDNIMIEGSSGSGVYAVTPSGRLRLVGLVNGGGNAAADASTDLFLVDDVLGKEGKTLQSHQKTRLSTFCRWKRIAGVTRSEIRLGRMHMDPTEYSANLFRDIVRYLERAEEFPLDFASTEWNGLLSLLDIEHNSHLSMDQKTAIFRLALSRPGLGVPLAALSVLAEESDPDFTDHLRSALGLQWLREGVAEVMQARKQNRLPRIGYVERDGRGEIELLFEPHDRPSGNAVAAVGSERVGPPPEDDNPPVSRESEENDSRSPRGTGDSERREENTRRGGGAS